MLSEITIDNLGVIPRATAEFSSGLTVLTGETGAGKTMVVTGLRLLAGGRADASRIRSGAAKATVEGRFLGAGLGHAAIEHLVQVLDEAGGEPDENGDFLLSRTVLAAGRSRAHLGGRSVPAATLAGFSQGLLTIHGQNDQLRLAVPEEQRAALDRFEASITPLRVAYDVTYRTWRELDRDLKQRTQSRRELAQEVDRLEFALAEIDRVDPQPGEDIELIATVRRLQDTDGLREQAAAALGNIDGAEALGEPTGSVDEVGAADLLGRAQAVLLHGEDPTLHAVGERLAVMVAELAELSGELGSFLSDLPTDPDALDQALTRQHDLKTLTRKYAPDIAGVLAWRDQARTRLSKIDTSAEAIEELHRRVVAAESQLRAAAERLSAARHAAAARLAAAVTEELHGLAMPKARFLVEVRPVSPGPGGADEVEFLLASSPRSAAKPLATAASGGELSRVMLALEVILSANSAGTTLVFDEVDSGVGGRAAVEIGRRLARLATRNQVIVVTHLPQVAAYADTHLNVRKEVSEEAAVSGVEELRDERRVEELARMLAGLADSDTGRAHAAELLARAQAESAKYKAAASPRA